MSQAAALLEQPALVINQKTKIFELNTEFGIFDENGQRVGSVAQVNQSFFTKFVRIFGDMDVAMPVTLEVRDGSGQPVLTLHKPWFRMKVAVTGANGTVLGEIGKRIRVGKARFSLRDMTGQEVGAVIAENWRAKDFRIEDRNGQEVARVTKKWEGFAKAIFTDADNYVVTLPPGLQEPLRSLSLGAALAIDTIMKQKDYGGSPLDLLGN